MKITLGNCQLEQCQEFVYLGGNITQDASCDKDIVRRIGLAAGIVRSLHQIWKEEDISKPTKVLLYKTLVQSIILYNSETWTLKEHHKRKLIVFEMSVLRKICGITKKDKRRNVDILKELLIEKDIVDLLKARRSTHFGHVNRMGNDRFPLMLLHGHTYGHRSRGRPKKKWLDDIREDCEDLNMSIIQAPRLTWNRNE